MTTNTMNATAKGRYGSSRRRGPARPRLVARVRRRGCSQARAQRVGIRVDQSPYGVSAGVAHVG